MKRIFLSVCLQTFYILCAFVSLFFFFYIFFNALFILDTAKQQLFANVISKCEMSGRNGTTINHLIMVNGIQIFQWNSSVSSSAETTALRNIHILSDWQTQNKGIQQTRIQTFRSRTIKQQKTNERSAYNLP